MLESNPDPDVLYFYKIIDFRTTRCDLGWDLPHFHICAGQFVIFKPLNYCCEETIGFDVKASFARRPVSHLIKPGDITKEF